MKNFLSALRQEKLTCDDTKFNHVEQQHYTEAHKTHITTSSIWHGKHAKHMREQKSDLEGTTRLLGSSAPALLGRFGCGGFPLAFAVTPRMLATETPIANLLCPMQLVGTGQDDVESD